MPVFHTSVRTVIDHDLCHNIVKVPVAAAVASWISSYFTNTTVHVITKFMINNRTESLKTDVSLAFFMITYCQIVRSHLLTHSINYKFMCLSAY